MTLQEQLIESILKFDSIGLDSGGYSLQIPTSDSLFTLDNINTLIAFFNKHGLACHYRFIEGRNCIDFPGQARRSTLENKIEELLKTAPNDIVRTASTNQVNFNSTPSSQSSSSANLNTAIDIEALVKKFLLASEQQRFREKGFLYQSLSGGIRGEDNDIYFNDSEAKALIFFLNTHSIGCRKSNTSDGDNDTMTWHKSEYIEFTDPSYRYHKTVGFEQFIDKIKKLPFDSNKVFFENTTDDIPQVKNVTPPEPQIDSMLYQQWRATAGANSVIGAPVGSAMDKLVNLVISKNKIASVNNKNGFRCNYSALGSSGYNDLSHAEINILINFFKSKSTALVCEIGYDSQDDYSAQFLLFPNTQSKQDIIKAIENFMRVDIASTANHNQSSDVKVMMASLYPAINNNNNNNAAPETLNQLIEKMADVEMKNLIKDMRTKATYTASAGLGFIYPFSDANQDKIIQLMSFFNDKLKEELCQYKEVEFTDARGSCMVLVFNHLKDQATLEDKIKQALLTKNVFSFLVKQ